ncbi:MULTISPECIES: CDP-diacylglycerol--serine O-phosphatidyltransferase [Nocardiopsis]|uniref:CDP-diacylglycerol--serine O-phosphatidyltransferase n=2 Tax=Nocardiopsis alba TaxID=53437 RepID=A0A7K2ILS9_9ACTN|nr:MULTISPECIES: CDP-diacylglycerol--serine O-phosphatidyltransferase [Nocardiopsis]AFR07798.1 CDP-diacylglycerol-serine O-phosphatidyltransferase [Nocardiopsis alba ATCC BAA-2165]MEC3894457.1 CDP-diacylglycerol--serine O-phosphatidyltransferase [Nocardiopsis sp. LDBS1602]MYR30941.1 CDP-diacylglycerol--serine O-phosphatidyltransferase [Nocardiopsis alba]
MTPTDTARAPEPAEVSEEAPRLRLGIADYLTLGNALCGFLAVCALAAAQSAHLAAGASGPLPKTAMATAVGLMMIAASLDVLDGRVARKLGGSGMGAELDNLADVISFGVAPAFFFVVWGTISGGTWTLPVAAAGAILLAVIVRLARFSCQAPGADYFTGLPCPFGAMAVVTIVLLDPPLLVGVAAVLLVAWLMVSRMEYPKPKGRKAYVVLGMLGTGVVLMVAWGLGLPAGDALIYLMSALVLLFIVTIPFYVIATRREASRVE